MVLGRFQTSTLLAGFLGFGLIFLLFLLISCIVLEFLNVLHWKKKYIKKLTLIGKWEKVTN